MAQRRPVEQVEPYGSGQAYSWCSFGSTLLWTKHQRCEMRRVGKGLVYSGYLVSDLLSLLLHLSENSLGLGMQGPMHVGKLMLVV